MNHKRVTIKEVAAAAGVSTQTVSRVVNGRPDVAPDTREHVQTVIQQLGYRPSKIARSLIQGQSMTLGVVSFGIGLYGPSLELQGVQEASEQAGYSLMLNILPDAEKFDADKILSNILSYHVDGILWAVPEIGQNRDWTQALLHNLTVPIVFLNVQPRPNQTTVVIDNRMGGKLATRHLLEQGRERIGIITGPMSWWEARQRELGWREELIANGRSVDESYIAHGDWTPQSGERGLQMLLDWHPNMDALFACNDQMVLGALNVARQKGLRVPEDIAIVGFDDIPEAPYFYPPLTTVRQNMIQLGREGVKQLISLIEDPDRSDLDAIRLHPELIVRDSSLLRIDSEK